MKISLNIPKNGYTTVQLYDLPNIEDGVCEEILADSCLHIFGPQDKASKLTEIIKKLKYEGLITIIGLDIELIANAFIHRRISIEEGMAQIYGGYLTTVEHVEAILTSAGLKIQSINIKPDTFMYTITASKLP